MVIETAAGRGRRHGLSVDRDHGPIGPTYEPVTAAKVEQRYTPAALAHADRIRAAGREPVVSAWEGDYTTPGIARIVITRVR